MHTGAPLLKVESNLAEEEGRGSRGSKGSKRQGSGGSRGGSVESPLTARSPVSTSSGTSDHNRGPVSPHRSNVFHTWSTAPPSLRRPSSGKQFLKKVEVNNFWLTTVTMESEQGK